MPGKINKERLRAFIMRRRINAYGLLVLTAIVALVTLICALVGFKRTDVLVVVTLLLIVLCFIQQLKMRRSFRTIHDFKGVRKKRKIED